LGQRGRYTKNSRGRNWGKKKGENEIDKGAYRHMSEEKGGAIWKKVK